MRPEQWPDVMTGCHQLPLGISSLSEHQSLSKGCANVSDFPAALLSRVTNWRLRNFARTGALFLESFAQAVRPCPYPWLLRHHSCVALRHLCVGSRGLLVVALLRLASVTCYA
jgi:hypothetical protein